MRTLGDEVLTAGINSSANAAINTLGYAGGFIFQVSAITAIGSWTAYMAATIAGALALYIPMRVVFEGLSAIGWKTNVSALILSFAYLAGSPIVGALLLNFLFAWTMPIMAVAVCAAIAGGIGIIISISLLLALSLGLLAGNVDNDNLYARNTNPVESSSRLGMFGNNAMKQTSDNKENGYNLDTENGSFDRNSRH